MYTPGCMKLRQLLDGLCTGRLSLFGQVLCRTCRNQQTEWQEGKILYAQSVATRRNNKVKGHHSSSPLIQVNVFATVSERIVSIVAPRRYDVILIVVSGCLYRQWKTKCTRAPYNWIHVQAQMPNFSSLQVVSQLYLHNFSASFLVIPLRISVARTIAWKGKQDMSRLVTDSVIIIQTGYQFINIQSFTVARTSNLSLRPLSHHGKCK